MATSVVVLELALFQQFNVSADIHEGMCDVSPLPILVQLGRASTLGPRSHISPGTPYQQASQCPKIGGVGGCHRVACKSWCLKSLKTPALAFSVESVDVELSSFLSSESQGR